MGGEKRETCVLIVFLWSLFVKWGGGEGEGSLGRLWS